MENFTFQSTLQLVRFLCFHSTIYKYVLTVNRGVRCWRSVHTRSVKRNGHKQRTSNHIRLEQPHDQGRVYSGTGVRQHWCKTAYIFLFCYLSLCQVVTLWRVDLCVTVEIEVEGYNIINPTNLIFLGKMMSVKYFTIQ